MNFYISNKMQKLKPSMIREIFKYALDPEVISLAGGDPAIESLPVEEMKQILTHMLDTNPRQALLYSQSEGDPSFRSVVKEYIKDFYQISMTHDDLMITSGAQQCMDLATKVLCDEGDTILCEDPSFIGSLNCFRSYGVRLVGIPMEQDGIDLAQLEHALKHEKNVRFIYLIPNFQNPTGITMSWEKRKAVYALAQHYRVAILEDNPYGDLRLFGEPIPAIKTLDTEGLVIYAGTFSKILATGIRVGYCVAPKEIFGKLTVAKQCTDVHTSTLSQLLCKQFLLTQDMHKHIIELQQIYQHKYNVILNAMFEYFPPGVDYQKPDGGIFVWCHLPNSVNTTKWATQLIQEQKVCVVPGTAFSVSGEEYHNCIRLNFSMQTPENIQIAIERIGQSLNEILI